jgi:hypothetical protein
LLQKAVLQVSIHIYLQQQQHWWLPQTNGLMREGRLHLATCLAAVSSTLRLQKTCDAAAAAAAAAASWVDRLLQNAVLDVSSHIHLQQHQQYDWRLHRHTIAR